MGLVYILQDGCRVTRVGGGGGSHLVGMGQQVNVMLSFVQPGVVCVFPVSSIHSIHSCFWLFSQSHGHSNSVRGWTLWILSCCC